jgi:hypothetical protein
MIAAVVLALVVSTSMGTLLLYLGWPHATTAWSRPLGLALGTGLGAALSAVLLFLWMLAFGPTRGFPLAEAGLLGLLVVMVVRRPKLPPTVQLPATDPSRHPRQRLLLASIAVVTLVAAGAAFVATLRQNPHGGWDAWMNWDLRARLLYRGGEHWRTAFSPVIFWSHPDYPPLLPLLVVRSWLYAGQETLLGPAVVAATFTFATAGLLAAALIELRGLSQGLLAGMVLLSTPFFILHGASLYADVPLAFFFLATVVLLGLNERHRSANLNVLAGLAAGLGLLVKHEGLLFALAVGASLVLTARTDGWKAARARGLAFSAGMLLPLLLLVSFKIAFKSPNDLLSTLGIERTLGRLSDPARYALTIRAYKNHLLSFGNNGFGSSVWLLMAYLLGIGVRLTPPCAGWAKKLVAALLLVLAAHFLVFVTMAHSLSGLLNSSLERLLLQLWPSALFLFFMLARTPEEAGLDRHLTTPSRRASPA